MKSKIIQVKQNSINWQEWRSKGLGASDAPIIMGDSPWTTRFELWAYKVGLLVRPEVNEYQKRAMQRGHDLEPKVRKWFEKRVGKKFPATSFEHGELSFLRASLDGYNEDSNENLEIKCPGNADHSKALKGIVPTKYFSQLQTQMLVSGACFSHYVSWDGEDSYAVIGVLPDKEYQSQILCAMLDMWSCIQNSIPPAIASKDVQKIFNIVRMDLERVNKSFKVLSIVCEAIKGGEEK